VARRLPVYRHVDAVPVAGVERRVLESGRRVRRRRRQVERPPRRRASGSRATACVRAPGRPRGSRTAVRPRGGPADSVPPSAGRASRPYYPVRPVLRKLFFGWSPPALVARRCTNWSPRIARTLFVRPRRSYRRVLQRRSYRNGYGTGRPRPRWVRDGVPPRDGYEKVDECDLVACADIVEENARAFADEFDLDDGNVFTDYEEMLETVEPEIVSICVPRRSTRTSRWTASERRRRRHPPVRSRWPTPTAGPGEMTEAAADHGVQLTFNHQRRFSDAVRPPRTCSTTARSATSNGWSSRPRSVSSTTAATFDLCNYFQRRDVGGG